VLEQIQRLSGSDRAFAVPTVNPAAGEGWKPGEDEASLSRLMVSFEGSIHKPGSLAKYMAVAYYKDGTEKDVTNNKSLIVTFSDKNHASLASPGVVRIGGIGSFSGTTEQVVVTFTYSDNQNQVFTSTKLLVEA